MTLEFPGRDLLIATIDDAVAQGDSAVITTRLCEAFGRMIRQNDVLLPPALLAPVPDHYARRELYTSPEFGYSVIAMVWGPGQGTPLHDHAGQWCTEGIWQGRLRVTQYTLLEQDGERHRLVAQAPVEEMAGSTGYLIPPNEYHVIENPSPDEVAVSLHVYARAMDRCNIFLPEDGGNDWYRRSERLLGTDVLDQP